MLKNKVSEIARGDPDEQRLTSKEFSFSKFHFAALLIFPTCTYTVFFFFTINLLPLQQMTVTNG